MNERPEPIREAERIIALDVLRGFALFGILMVNMAFFAMPFFIGLYDPSLADSPMSERLAFTFVKVFFEYKFVSLFSLLFGIGFAVQLMRARQRGGSFAWLYARRLAILFIIGLCHAMLLWYGDILLLYAVIGFALLLCGSLSPRTLFLLSGISLAVGIVLGTMMIGGQYVMGNAFADEIEVQHAHHAEIIARGDAPSGFAAIRKATFSPDDPIWLDAEMRAFRDGPFGDAVAFRATIYFFYLVYSAFGFGWHILAMFLLGAAMMKVDFFSPDRRKWHRQLALFALPIGLLLEAVNALVIWLGGFGFALGTLLMFPVHEIGSVLLMLGYVGVILLIVNPSRPPAQARHEVGAAEDSRIEDNATAQPASGWRNAGGPIAAAGRMALTVYLSQTVIATGITYWWGLGWFGSVTRLQLIGLCIAIYAALVLFSVVWLRFFQYGPMEWLWRSLTYGRLMPLAR